MKEGRYKDMGIMELFEDKTNLVKMCAPMVRYSKLPFRLLVREYGCDLAFTPMIIAESYVKSEKCRLAEFITNERDEPVIVQMAAKDPVYLAEAAEMVYKHSNGIDLNCGCPQSWAIKDGLGCGVMRSPELAADILRQTRNRISDPSFTVSAKIRVFDSVERTVDLARQLEAAGISWLTVHARTRAERSQPVRLDTLKTIVDSLDIPVIANGDIDSLEIAYRVQELTGVRGVMSARKILENPGIFAGHEFTPDEVIRRFVEINSELHTHFTIFHRHLIFMTESRFTKEERRRFNDLKTKTAVVTMLNEKFDLDLPVPDLEQDVDRCHDPAEVHFQEPRLVTSMSS